MTRHLPVVANVIFFLLMTSLPRPSQSCFPVQEIFGDRYNWIQSISLHARKLITVGYESENIMTIETEGLVKHQKTKVLCLMAYGKNRYLVRVDEPDKRYTFQCLQFTILEPRVIRQGRTKPAFVRKKVNCIDDPYTEDEAVLVSYVDQNPQPCPLSGGYQLIMHQGTAIASHCLDSVTEYNPRIQFQCDRENSANVIVDFGRACMPVVLGDEMIGRQFAPLECMAHWEEDDFKSLLLRMKFAPSVFWCLHYKPAKRDKGVIITSDTEQYWSIFLTLDGRCPSQAFGGRDMPRNSSAFGHLASYRPLNDLKCQEKAYLENCELSTGHKCMESTECPASCGRCKPMLTTLNCSFPANTHGKWAALDSRRKLELTVENTKFSGSSFGEFMCSGPAESSLPEYTYPVVQTGVSSTCMPSYSCARLDSPAPGLLTFRLRASVRDPDTGKALSCQATENQVGHIYPRALEKVMTLVTTNKLPRVSCDILFAPTFPTLLGDCRLAIDECRDDCQVLNAKFDVDTCGNNTGFNIENEHECLAVLEFVDGMRGIMTKSLDNGRYMCWIFSPNRLFIAPPAECNQESVTRIYQDPDARVTYDPVNRISLPLSGSSDNSNAHIKQVLHSVLILCALIQVALAYF